QGRRDHHGTQDRQPRGRAGTGDDDRKGGVQPRNSQGQIRASGRGEGADQQVRQVKSMNYYQQHQSQFVEGLKTFLRIPSISTLSEHKPDIRRAAEFARDELSAAGLAAELIEGEGNPLVYAEWLGAPGKPTILFYGHYDVQPPDPLDEWKSPPFEPEIRGDNIYARGACDDKGQTLILMNAV